MKVNFWWCIFLFVLRILRGPFCYLNLLVISFKLFTIYKTAGVVKYILTKRANIWNKKKEMFEHNNVVTVSLFLHFYVQFFFKWCTTLHIKSFKPLREFQVLCFNRKFLLSTIPFTSFVPTSTNKMKGCIPLLLDLCLVSSS